MRQKAAHFGGWIVAAVLVLAAVDSWVFYNQQQRMQALIGGKPIKISPAQIVQARP